MVAVVEKEEEGVGAPGVVDAELALPANIYMVYNECLSFSLSLMYTYLYRFKSDWGPIGPPSDLKRAVNFFLLRLDEIYEYLHFQRLF